jgi:hypothetical protein
MGVFDRIIHQAGVMGGKRMKLLLDMNFFRLMNIAVAPQAAICQIGINGKI